MSYNLILASWFVITILVYEKHLIISNTCFIKIPLGCEWKHSSEFRTSLLFAVSCAKAGITVSHTAVVNVLSISALELAGKIIRNSKISQYLQCFVATRGISWGNYLDFQVCVCYRHKTLQLHQLRKAACQKRSILNISE